MTVDVHYDVVPADEERTAAMEKKKKRCWRSLHSTFNTLLFVLVLVVLAAQHLANKTPQSLAEPGRSAAVVGVRSDQPPENASLAGEGGVPSTEPLSAGRPGVTEPPAQVEEETNPGGTATTETHHEDSTELPDLTLNTTPPTSTSDTLATTYGDTPNDAKLKTVGPLTPCTTPQSETTLTTETAPLEPTLPPETSSSLTPDPCLNCLTSSAVFTFSLVECVDLLLRDHLGEILCPGDNTVIAAIRVNKRNDGQETIKHVTCCSLLVHLT